ncbi:MAG: DsrE family protein [Bacteroidota bacterium]|jgi:intracellular sulfur oxidation DsrE/DsrF family protein
MKNTILLFAFGMLCCSATVVAQNTTPTTTHKVVVQLNSADTAAWGGVIGNIKNLSKIWPDQLQIEVVVHGRALDFLVASKSHLVNDVEHLSKKGIVFSACENTMGKYGITKQMLIPAVFTVPSGVGEVILKQEQGWSYLRAGY